MGGRHRHLIDDDEDDEDEEEEEEDVHMYLGGMTPDERAKHQKLLNGTDNKKKGLL